MSLLSLEPEARIRGRNATKADVLLVRWDGRRIALKDYGARPFLVRHTIGRLLVSRECAAYRAARGIEGLPEFVGRVGPFALAVAWVEGTRLADLGGREVPSEAFDRLDRIVETVHARGIALGDLHHRDVLVDPRGDVSVVDLAAAWILGNRPAAWRRRVFRRLEALDRIAAARMRVRFTGVPESVAMAGIAPEDLRRHARGRRLKRAWDALRGRRPGPRRCQEGAEVGYPPASREIDVTQKPYSRTLGALRLLATFALVVALVAAARPRPVWVAVGFLVAATGEAVRFWAAGHLLKTEELVTAGPYRYTRNPLYLGRLLIFTGLCVMATLPWGLNWAILATGYAVFFGYYLPRKERVEPTRLRARHGDAFDRYFRSVPALFPSRPPWPHPSPGVWSSDRMIRNREHWMVFGLLAVTAFLMWRAYQPPEIRPSPEPPAGIASP